MSTSRHQQTAEALKTAITGWSSLPSGWTAERVYSLSRRVKDMKSGSSDIGVIAVLATSVNDTDAGRHNHADDIVVAVAVLARLSKITTDVCDVVDVLAENLRTFLRKDSSLASVTFTGGLQAQRKNVSLPTTADVVSLDEQDVFCAIIECNYRCPVEAV